MRGEEMLKSWNTTIMLVQEIQIYSVKKFTYRSIWEKCHKLVSGGVHEYFLIHTHTGIQFSSFTQDFTIM